MREEVHQTLSPCKHIINSRLYFSKTIYTDPAGFCVCTFLREDRTPYYMGKG